MTQRASFESEIQALGQALIRDYEGGRLIDRLEPFTQNARPANLQFNYTWFKHKVNRDGKIICLYLIQRADASRVCAQRNGLG